MQQNEFNWLIPGLDKNQGRAGTIKFIIENIKSGNLMPGDPILPYRQLAKLNDVSPNTIKRAYAELILMHWLLTKLGDRTYVADRTPESKVTYRMSGFSDRFPAGLGIPKDILKRPDHYIPQPFAAVGTYTPSETLFPHDVFNQYCTRHRIKNANLSQAELLESYKAEYLKKAIVNDLNLRRNFGIKPGMLEIIKERKASLERVFKILLDKPDQIVISTSTFDVALISVLREHKCIMHTISLSQGDFMAKIEELLKIKQVRAIYVKPQCSFPERIALTTDQCNKLIDLAKKYKTCIVEEDEDHEFYSGNAPYRPLACYDHAGYVIYLGTLSASTSYTYSLRMIVASLQFIATLEAMPAQSIEQRNLITEKAIADMITNGDLTTYQKQLRIAAKKGRDDLARVLNANLQQYISFETPEHGLMFWLKFRDDIDLNVLLHNLEKSGIKVPFHPNNQKTKNKINHMLLGFAHYQHEEAEGAAKKIAEMLNATQGG